VNIFPGADGAFALYEDDGETVAYQKGRFARTLFAQTAQAGSLTFTIAPVQGDAKVAPSPSSWLMCGRRARGVGNNQ
jgi:alpha-glucosidase (family GH31 glycosyl hydrolase)